jgi:simple sugar transport system permease protein
MLEVATAILVAAVPATTAILLAAMGGLVNRQGGIVNIGLEGLMLAGAFAAVAASAAAASWQIGVVAAGAVGALLGLAFSWTMTRLGADQIIAGLGLNLVVLGFLGYLLPIRFGVQGTYLPDGVVALPRFALPLVGDLPLLGQILSPQTPLTFLSWLAVPIIAVLLYRTAWGIALRAAGADAQAARAAGVAVLRWRDLSTVVAGLMAGLAGAHLALGVVTLFNKNMTAGRGFIALAAIYFGAARPWPTAAAAFLFGIFEAASFRYGSAGLAPQLVQMLPYLVVVVSLTLVALRKRWSVRQRAARAAALAPGGGVP